MSNQALIDYIKSCLAVGRTKDQIYRDLLDNHHSVNDINQAFNEIEGKEAPLAIEPKEDLDSAQKNAVGVLSVIGAIVVGLGVLLFIASNWQQIDKFGKVVMLVGLMIIFYVLGWLLKEKWGYIKSGQALFLLGSMVYGGSIFLVAQIYNVRLLWPDGFILWMIGCLVMAWALEYYPLYVLAGIVGLISVISHPFFILINPLSMMDMFFLTSTCFFFLGLFFFGG